MRMTNNFERIGDEVENIAELMEELIEQDLSLSEGGTNDYKHISDEVRSFLESVVHAIRADDKTIKHNARKMEEKVNEMHDTMKDNHIMRLQSGACTIED